MKSRYVAIAMLAFLSGQVLAQSVAPVRDPADARAVVPPVMYVSPFAGYRSFKDERVADWKNANDVVGQIGGWKVYAREASQP